MSKITLPGLKGEREDLPVLYQKAIYFIESHAKRRGEIRNNIISYPSTYHTLSTMLHLSKDEAITVFEELRGAGLIEIVPYCGIRIVPGAEVEDLRSTEERGEYP